MSWAVSFVLRRSTQLTQGERDLLEAHLGKHARGARASGRYELTVAPEPGVLAAGLVQLRARGQVRRVLVALGELRTLLVDATLEVHDDLDAISLVDGRYALAGGEALLDDPVDDPRQRRRVLYPSEGARSASFLRPDPKKTRLTLARDVRFDAHLSVLGNGDARLLGLSIVLLDRDRGVVHRHDDAIQVALPSGLGCEFTRRVVPPVGWRARSVDVIEVHDRSVQQFPQELLVQIAVVARDPIEPWSLAEPRRLRHRGPTIREIVVRPTATTVDVCVGFDPSQASRRYEAARLTVLGTTTEGAEIERGEAPVRAGEVSIVSIPVTAERRARIGMFDLRLEGTVHHDGLLATFLAHPP